MGQAGRPVCRKSFARIYAGLPATMPTTYAGRFAVAKLVAPLEQQDLSNLEAIRAARTPAIERALAALRADLQEAQKALASTGDTAAFTRLYTTWQNDQAAPKAFSAAGVPACAG